MRRFRPLFLLMGLALLLLYGALELGRSVKLQLDRAHQLRQDALPCQEGCSSLSSALIPNGLSKRLTLPRMATTPAHSAALRTNSARSISA